MVRRNGWVRVLGSGVRGIALLGLALAVVVPACGGKSVTTGDEGDDKSTPADDGFGDGDGRGDDDSGDGTSDDSGGALGGRGGSTPTPPQGGVGGTGGVIVTGGVSPMGGAVPIGGTIADGGTGVGGRPPTGGAAGTPATGGTIPTAGVGGTGGVNDSVQCRGIRSNMACTPEGTQCTNLICGLADSGRRACNCATNWTCTSCDYTNSPFRYPPAVLLPCSAEAADEVPCTQVNTVCSSVNAEVCACYQDPTDGLIWDCDSPPIGW